MRPRGEGTHWFASSVRHVVHVDVVSCCLSCLAGSWLGRAPHGRLAWRGITHLCIPSCPPPAPGLPCPALNPDLCAPSCPPALPCPAEVVREVQLIIFDEIHYLRDKERGVVWEESIILAPRFGQQGRWRR